MLRRGLAVMRVVCTVLLLTLVYTLSEMTLGGDPRPTLHLEPVHVQGMTLGGDSRHAVHQEPVSVLERQDGVGKTEDRRGPPPLILVLGAYPRTGSSYLGALLSSPRGASYLYEPLVNLPVMLRSEYTRLIPTEHVQAAVQRMFLCQYSSVKYLFHPRPASNIIMKPPLTGLRKEQMMSAERACEVASPRVIKLVRARLGQVTPLLQPSAWADLTNRIKNSEGNGNNSINNSDNSISNPGINFKIIYLVRDPRAILTSIYERKEDFIRERQDPKALCEFLNSDLEELEALGAEQERVKVLRYEDMVADQEVSAGLLAFVNVPVTEEVSLFLIKHRKNNTEHVNRNNYYSTFKRFNKPVERWRWQLPKDIRRQVEIECRKVLLHFSYDLDTTHDNY